jgi:hypothetical protein
LKNRSWNSSILYVRYFRGADDYLVVAKVMERLAVSKQVAQKLMWNLRKLNELDVRRQYQITISNNFAALGNLNVSEGINMAWENTTENIEASAKRQSMSLRTEAAQTMV